MPDKVDPKVSSANLTVRSFRRDDIPVMLEWFHSDHDVKQWGGPALSISKLPSQLEKIEAGETKWNAFSVDGGSQGLLGHFQIAFDPLLNTVVLGRVAVAPNARGRGAGAALALMAVEKGFATPAHRLELRVFTFNAAAIRVYEKIGFVSEGVCRDASPFGDTYWDVRIMSLLRPEWVELQLGNKS